jgi:hypothetical protein
MFVDSSVIKEYNTELSHSALYWEFWIEENMNITILMTVKVWIEPSTAKVPITSLDNDAFNILSQSFCKRVGARLQW